MLSNIASCLAASHLYQHTMSFSASACLNRCDDRAREIPLTQTMHCFSHFVQMHQQWFELRKSFQEYGGCDGPDEVMLKRARALTQTEASLCQTDTAMNDIGGNNAPTLIPVTRLEELVVALTQTQTVGDLQQTVTPQGKCIRELEEIGRQVSGIMARNRLALGHSVLRRRSHYHIISLSIFHYVLYLIIVHPFKCAIVKYQCSHGQGLRRRRGCWRLCHQGISYAVGSQS